MFINSKGNYVDGKWNVASGEIMCSVSPVTEESIWQGNASNAQEIQSAVIAAKKAFGYWSKKNVDERIEFVYKYREILKDNTDYLARYISYEVGKPLWEAKTEVNSMIGKVDSSIDAYFQRNKEVINNQGKTKSITKFRPHGVAAIIGPYNFPGHMPNGHILPALIAGNTIVLKPSEKVPCVSEIIMELWEKTGIPNGVINMVQGMGNIGDMLVNHDDINAVFFTGSRYVGRKIAEACLNKKICALEMGGNSPLIVWDAVDIDAAVLMTIQSAFITSGQRCSSARRLIVKEGDFGDAFLKRLQQVCEKLVIGKVEDMPEPFMGPMKNCELVNELLDFQNKLIAFGAKIIVKSKRISDLGSAYVTPGIIDVTGLDIEDVEVIGPFLRVARMSSLDEAINEANNTKYGLAAGIITEDKCLYNEFAEKIEAGIVNWNQQLTGASGRAPFGGIKESGNYRPSGYLATDYCVYTVASMENDSVCLPETLPKGVVL